MSDNIERLGTSEVRIQVQIPWSELKPRYDESLSKLRSSIQVRGFRKGKVPAAMIEKMMGEKLTHEIAVEEVGRKIQEIITREKIMPLRIPLDIERDVKLESGRDASFDARIEVLPMIEAIAFDQVQLTPKREITDELIMERLTLMAARKAPLMTAPDDREIGEYDQVVLAGDADFDDEQGPQKVTDFRVDLAPWTQPPPGLVEQLGGKKKGHEDEISLVLPQRADDRTSYKYANLKYRVEEVVARTIPAIDDELARDFDMESLDELKKEVREAIEKEALDEYIEKNGSEIIDQLLDTVQFDLPPSYRMIADMGKGDDEPAEPGTADGSEASPEDEEKSARDRDMARVFERMLRRNLLTTVIAQQNGISLPRETMKQASERMREYIDRQDGSRKEKDEAFEKWQQEFEQNLFNHVLSTFLVQEVEKARGIAPEAASDAKRTGEDAGAEPQDSQEDRG